MGNQQYFDKSASFRGSSSHRPCDPMELDFITIEDHEFVDPVWSHFRYQLDLEPTDDLTDDHLPSNFGKKSGADDNENMHNAERLLNEIYSRQMCGFKTPESHIQDLQEPAHMKFFSALNQEGGTLREVRDRLWKKCKILYAMYLLKTTDDKESFQDQLTKILKEIKESSGSSDSKGGFGFIMFILQEMNGMGVVPEHILTNVLDQLEKLDVGDDPHYRESFKHDEAIDNAKSALLKIIAGRDAKLASIAYRVLFKIGLIRCRVEDMLLIGNLLQKETRAEIDLRPEIQQLTNYYEKQAQKAEETLETTGDEEGDKVKEDEPFDPLLNYEEDEHWMRFCSKSSQGFTPSATADYWECDGDFFYECDSIGGLHKMTTAAHGRMAGRMLAQNRDHAYKDISMMLLDDKLYIRSSSIAPYPFIVVDKNTLKEIEMDPNQDFEPKDGDIHSLQWKEQDEETGRSLTYTPMFTDGQYVYVIARYFETKEQKEARGEDQEEPKPDLVVEVYDPSNNFEFVRKVTLFTKPDVKYMKEENSIDWLKKTKWATNGTHLILFKNSDRIKFFDLATGQKVKKMRYNHDYSDYHYTYDRTSGTFYYIYNYSEMKYRTFKFDKFHFKNEQSNEEKKEKAADESTNKDKPQRSIFGSLMKQITSKDINSADTFDNQMKKLENQEANKLTAAYIYKLFTVKNYRFQSELKKVEKKDDKDSLMKIFRYPLVTHLSQTTFMALAKSLSDQFKYLNKTSNPTDVDYECFLSTLTILKANLQAIKYCQANLGNILTDKAEEQKFKNLFTSGCIFKCAEGTGVDNLKAQYDHWININMLCKQIQQSYANTPDQVLSSLNSKLDEGQLDGCQSMISQLAKKVQIKALLSSENYESNIDNLVEVFIKLCQISANLVKTHLESIRFDEEVVQFTPKSQSDFTNILVCGEYLVNVVGEMNFLYTRKNDDFCIKLKDKQEEKDKIQKLRTKLSQGLSHMSQVAFFELSQYYAIIMDELEESCKYRTEKKHFEGYEELYKNYEKIVCSIMLSYTQLQQVVQVNMFSHYMNTGPDSTWTMKTLQGSEQLLLQLNRFYTFQKKYGDKIKCLGVELQQRDHYYTLPYDHQIRDLIGNLHKHVSWHFGYLASMFIKKEPIKEPEPVTEGLPPKQKKKIEVEKHRAQLLQNVSKSNLLSGGLDPKYFNCFSAKTKAELKVNAQLLEDDIMLKYLNQEEAENGDEIDILEAVAFEGKSQDTEKLIKALHTIQMQGLRIEGAPVTLRADMGGAQVQRADGMKVTRYAFSIMLKFSDLSRDIKAMQDAVLSAESPQDIKQKIAFSAGAEEILNCWKSASQMRRWLQEKKSKRSDKLTTRLMNAAKQKKKFTVVMRERALRSIFKAKKSFREEQERLKKEQEEKDENQIDSSTRPEDANKEKEPIPVKEDEEQKKAEEMEEEIDETKYALTEEEKEAINDQAFDKSVEHTQIIIKKIADKTAFLLKFNIPKQFHKQDPTLMKNGMLKIMMIKAPQADAEEKKVQQLDWISKLKQWKKNQQQEGAITSLTAQKKEIWESGLTAVKALLQTSVEADKIQASVEQIYICASQRCAGIKLFQNIMKVEMPTMAYENLINWFMSAFRQNENKLCHYLDDLSGQGIHLENLSRKYFFQIIKSIVDKLKSSKDKSTIKMYLSLLKWNFDANDHQELLKLGIFNVLHQGSNEEGNLFKNAWGRSLKITSLTIDEQSIQNDIINTFEEFFLTVTSRIVLKQDEDSGSGDSNNLLRTLSGSKQLVDTDTSGILLGQAFDIIFKEFERYIGIMMQFEGMDWDIFVRKRNQDRKETYDNLPDLYADDSMLDEAEQFNYLSNYKDDSNFFIEQFEDRDPLNKEKIVKTTRLIENDQFTKLGKLYQESFLIRLLKLVELLTCVAQSNEQTLSIVRKIADPYHMGLLINLMLICSPKLKIILLKIIQHIILIKTPVDVFEQAVNNLNSDPNSLTNWILNKIHPKIGFEKSMFLQLLYKYLLLMRSKMWVAQETGSDYQYAVTLSVTNLLRTINAQEDSNWSVQIKENMTQALQMIESIPVQEIDAFMSLLPGGEYGGMTSGQPAVTNDKETVIVLGYSSTWKEAKDFKDKDQSDCQKMLQKISITPAFISKDQQAITLYYNEEQKDKQELMVLSPSKLSPISYLSSKDGLKIAQNSPLLDINIVKALIGLLKGENHEESGLSKAQISVNQFKQCSILKILCQQIKDLGQDYIHFLEKEGVLTDLISYLFQDENITMSDDDQKNLMMPLNWLEAKIQRIRKFAIESANGLNYKEESEGATIHILNDKQILLQRTDAKGNKAFSTNITFSAAFNFYKLDKDAMYKCTLANELNVIENSVLKNGMVIMDYSELTKLEPRTLSILNNSEVIMANLPKEDANVDELFQRIVDIFHDDARKPKKKTKGFKNLLEVAVIFIPDESYANLTKPLEELKKDAVQIDYSSETFIKGPVGLLLSELKQLAGIDEDDAIYNLNPNNLNDVTTAIKQIKDGIIEKQKQEQEYKDALEKAQKEKKEKDEEEKAQNEKEEKDEEEIKKVQEEIKKIEEEIKKIEEAEVERLKKRKEVITEKKKILMEASESQASIAQDNDLDFNIPNMVHFDDFSTQTEWWQELQKIVNDNLKEKIKADTIETVDEKGKTDSQMTQMIFELMNSFNKNDLVAEHAQTINLLTHMQRKSCIIEIFKLTKIEQILPILVQSQNDMKKFAKFMKSQFNSAIIKKLKIGQNVGYQSMKQIMGNVFDFCNDSEQMSQFVQYFLIQEVILPGIYYSKERNDQGLIDYFQVEAKASTAVNPYIMIFVTKYLMKKDSAVLRETRHALSNLFNLHLLFALKFEKNKKLARKFLKCAIKLILYSKKHLKELAEAGELHPMIQNKLVGLVTKDMKLDKEADMKLKEQQQIWLELHLMLNELQWRVYDKCGISIEKTIENSEKILQLMGNKRTLAEGENFDFLLYLYHLKACTDEMKEPMSKKFSSNKPCFNIPTRGYVSLPEFDAIEIKIRDSSKLRPFSEFAISSKPDGNDMRFYDDTCKKILWPNNQMYLAYPLKSQKIIAFGENNNKQLGSVPSGESDDYFKNQMNPILLEKKYMPENFKPKRIYCGQQFTVIIGEDGKLVESGYLQYVGSKEYFRKDETLKKKVIMASISNYNMWVLLEDNTLWFKGYSIGSVLPGNRDFTEFTKLDQWSSDADDNDDKIVEVTAGYNQMYFVTEKGKLWIRGSDPISKFGQEGGGETRKAKLPENQLARRVWCNKEDDGYACIALFEDKETGKKTIQSAGDQYNGLLGQGDDVGTASSEFGKLDFDQEDNYFVDIAMRTRGALAIDTKGKLWAWGNNEHLNQGFLESNSDPFLYSPKEVYTLNELNLKAKQIRMGQYHSLVLFEDQEGRSHLYSIGYGNKSYLGLTEEQYVSSDKQKEMPCKEITQFEDAKIMDFACCQFASLVLLQGDDGDVDEKLFQHELSDGSKCKGLLHFYKKENDMFFIPQNEYEERKDELPELSLAIRYPIKGIQEKEWPDLAALAAEVLDQAAAEIKHAQKDSTTDEPITGPLYHAKFKLNEQDVEVNHSEAEVVKDDNYTINPLIYYRLAKPLKDGKELPQLDLTKYYDTDAPFQFEFQFNPDLSQKKNEQFLELTKDAWAETQSVVNKKLDPDVKKEILELLDRLLKSQLDEEDLYKIDVDEYIKLEGVTYKSKDLQEMPEKQVKQLLNLYWSLNLHLNDLLYYQTTALKHIPDSNANVVQKNMSNLLTSFKTKSVQKQIEKLPTGGTGEIRIHRLKAAKFYDSGKVDHEGRKTIFGQIYQQCQKNKNLMEHFKQNDPQERFWNTKMVGEGSQDVGGPFREMLTNVASEIQSNYLPLMIKTTNNKSEWGFARECWTLNPDANSPTHQELFKLMGRFLGYSIRTGGAIDWHFPPILWKQLVGEKIVMKDFDSFDTYALSAWHQMSNLAAQFTADDFNAGVEETFTTILTSTKQVPICPGGEEMQVTYDNYREYIEMSMQARINEASNQLKWLKEGVNEIINLDILSMLNWAEIEQRACGGDIQTDALKSITEYVSCDEDSKVIKWFWKIFDSYSQEDRKNYLKFSWGRSKLPFDVAKQGSSQKHKLDYYSSRDPKSFPKAHTCFFTTDLPAYDDFDVMQERITYAIQTCDAIDDDGDPNRDYGGEDDSD